MVGGLTIVIWSVVGGLTTVSGRWSVVVLVGGRFFHSYWSMVVGFSDRWSVVSLVGGSFGRWSVIF